MRPGNGGSQVSFSALHGSEVSRTKSYRWNIYTVGSIHSFGGHDGRVHERFQRRWARDCERDRWDRAAGSSRPDHIVWFVFRAAVTRLAPETGEDRGASRPSRSQVPSADLIRGGLLSSSAWLVG